MRGAPAKKEDILPLPTVCLTFDEWPEAATEAYGIMAAHGLVGTYFVTPSMVDQAGGPALATILSMKQAGWEIGVYSGVNMVTLEANSRVLANNKLRDLKNAMWALGLPVTSIAPAQRAWNNLNRRLTQGIFSGVRVADEFRNTVGHWGVFPVADPLYTRGGGTASLSSVDTVASLTAQVDDLIALGGYWIVVLHRVSNDGQEPSYTLDKTKFTAFCAKISSEVTAGTLRCVPFGGLG